MTGRLPVLVDGIAHFPADIAELAQADLFQPFALLVEVFVDPDGSLLHHGVGLLASAAEDEVLSTGEPGMAVVMVKGQSQQRGGFAVAIRRPHPRASCRPLL